MHQPLGCSLISWACYSSTGFYNVNRWISFQLQPHIMGMLLFDKRLKEVTDTNNKLQPHIMGMLLFDIKTYSLKHSLDAGVAASYHGHVTLR
jgi:hypothetical protein